MICEHLPCQHWLFNECYNKAAPEEVDALSNLWAKILILHGNHYITKEMRNDVGKKNGNHYFSCGKKEHAVADGLSSSSSFLLLSKFVDPNSGVDITVKPHPRNPEQKEEDTFKDPNQNALRNKVMVCWIFWWYHIREYNG